MAPKLDRTILMEAALNEFKEEMLPGFSELTIHMPPVKNPANLWEFLATLCKIVETARGMGWRFKLYRIDYAESYYNNT